MKIDRCVICGHKLINGQSDWHFVCSNCGYEKSTLTPAINDREAHDNVDEKSREKGLLTLRMNNFRIIVEKIRTLSKSDSPLILDVGCAHGWFIEAASPYFRTLGIEPDNNVFAATKKKYGEIRNGYFPDVLKNGEMFDVIVFNDVFEHIKDVGSILDECHSRINPSGLLVINLPNSKGVFYLTSKILTKFGINSFFERLWQMGMPSPHLHYFNANNLQHLVEQKGFNLVCQNTLPSLTLNGLYSRIALEGESSKGRNIILYICVAITLPFLSMLPKDIIYGIYRRS